eukprot:scaffold35626_cov124-Isochrysis_galbana.AAC.4
MAPCNPKSSGSASRMASASLRSSNEALDTPLSLSIGHGDRPVTPRPAGDGSSGVTECVLHSSTSPAGRPCPPAGDASLTLAPPSAAAGRCPSRGGAAPGGVASPCGI